VLVEVHHASLNLWGHPTRPSGRRDARGGLLARGCGSVLAGSDAGRGRLEAGWWRWPLGACVSAWWPRPGRWPKVPATVAS